ncbi:hypothetical protein NCG97_00890 [Streptomyces lydicamycinicus]|nr:hypothetical protein [Streptomyces lydicamycinicus]URZ99546.1 hypothetical protein NCG97_00890 [Streptomyces lydicamycinicus]
MIAQRARRADAAADISELVGQVGDAAWHHAAERTQDFQARIRSAV